MKYQEEIEQIVKLVPVDQQELVRVWLDLLIAMVDRDSNKEASETILEVINRRS